MLTIACCLVTVRIRVRITFSVWFYAQSRDVTAPHVYRVVQKTGTQFYFWDKFGNSAPISTIVVPYELYELYDWGKVPEFHGNLY